eukprot:gene25801-biopygen20292
MLWLAHIVLLLASSSRCSASLVSRKLQDASPRSLVGRKLQDASPLTVDLGQATGFSVLAYATVTNSGYTKVGGYIGVTPGTSITGETQISYFSEPTSSGRLGCPTAATAAAAAAPAKLDLTAAYLDASLRVENVNILSPAVLNIGGCTLYPGLYKTTGSLEVSSGTLYLSGNGVFIFQMETTLLVSTVQIRATSRHG